jgi:hypothetical protein
MITISQIMYKILMRPIIFASSLHLIQAVLISGLRHTSKPNPLNVYT